MHNMIIAPVYDHGNQTILAAESFLITPWVLIRLTYDMVTITRMNAYEML